MTDYLQVPSGHTRASLASELTRLISSFIAPQADHFTVTGPTWLLRHFICSTITSSRSKVSTLLVALTYLNRVKTRLDPGSFGETLVRERIFIAALILATKYTNDSVYGNSKWARQARIFTAREISGAELQLLHTLGWDLSITEEDVQGQTSCILG